jgi:hypothetical protein
VTHFSRFPQKPKSRRPALVVGGAAGIGADAVAVGFGLSVTRGSAAFGVASGGGPWDATGGGAELAAGGALSIALGGAGGAGDAAAVALTGVVLGAGSGRLPKRRTPIAATLATRRRPPIAAPTIFGIAFGLGDSENVCETGLGV